MSRATSALAVVQVDDERLQLQEFELPPIGAEEALLRVERCGLCGSDIDQFRRGALSPYPVIPGHEPVGIIETIGDRATERWGITPGDRVIVEAAVPCRSCRYCAEGKYPNCPNRYVIGLTRTQVKPSLWGGYAEYLYLHPNASVHKISKDVPLDAAALFNSLACGINWGVDLPRTQPGDCVLVLGAGQRALACVLAAKAAGAAKVIMTGLHRDRHKLSMALVLGADYAIDVEEDDTVGTVRSLAPEGVDVAIDVVPHAVETVVHAVDLVRDRGTVVLAGLKGNQPMKSLSTDRIVSKALTMRGAWSKTTDVYGKAIRLIESDRLPLKQLRTHIQTFSITDAATAIRTLAGELPDEQTTIWVNLCPTI